jgi:hypothetical protein
MSFKLEKTKQAFCEESRAVEFEQVLVDTVDNVYGVTVKSKIIAVWSGFDMQFVVKAECTFDKTEYTKQYKNTINADKSFIKACRRSFKYYEKSFKTYEEARAFDLDLPLIFKEYLKNN